MSSLGLIIRSSIPALTLVLAGSVLILLNRWMFGNREDVLQIIVGHPLNTSSGEPQNAASSDICLFFYGMTIVLGLAHFLNLYKLFFKYFTDPRNGPCYDDSANFIVTFFFGYCYIAVMLGICTWCVNIYAMLLLFYLYILILNAREYFKSKVLDERLRSIVINNNGFRMSSLGLIIRSSIPALTSVLAGSVLILLNRWMNGTDVDKYYVERIIGGHVLNTPLDQPQLDTVSPDVCRFFGGMVFIVGLIYFRNLAMLFYKSPLNVEGKANCVWSLFSGCAVCTLGMVVCLSPINIYFMLTLLCLYIFTLNLLEYLASEQLNVRP